MTCFKYFFTSSLFLIGQLSSFEMCAISFSLSLFSVLQSYIRWSTVWLPLVQGHSGDSIILNQCRYDLVFPWAVIIAVKLVVKLVFIFSVALMFGKNSLVAYPLVQFSHCFCHFSMLFSLSWRSTGLSKKMDGIWNSYNLKSTGQIYTFGVLKYSEKFKVLDLP